MTPCQTHRMQYLPAARLTVHVRLGAVFETNSTRVHRGTSLRGHQLTHETERRAVLDKVLAASAHGPLQDLVQSAPRIVEDAGVFYEFGMLHDTRVNHKHAFVPVPVHF